MAHLERDPLKQSLTRLYAELARTPRLDESARQRLRAALADIERRLEQGGEVREARKHAAATAVGRAGRAGLAPDAVSGAAEHPLEALAVGFEADHPTLAASVRQFIDLLVRAGL